MRFTYIFILFICGCSNLSLPEQQRNIDATDARYLAKIRNAEEGRIYKSQQLLKIARRLDAVMPQFCNGNCAYKVILADENTDIKFKRHNILNNSAEKIYISEKAWGMIESDNDLLILLSHAYARNILGDIDEINETSLWGNLLAKFLDDGISGAGLKTQGIFGEKAKEIISSTNRDAVMMADYLSLYLVAAADGDYSQALKLYKKIIKKYPSLVFNGRLSNIDATIKELQLKEQQNAKLIPNYGG